MDGTLPRNVLPAGRPWRGDGQSFVGVCVWSGGWRKLLEDFDCFIYLKNCSLALRGGTSGAFDSERGLLSPFLLPLIPAPRPRVLASVPAASDLGQAV